MNAFRQHRGLVVPLRRNDIDTDQIVPKQFLAVTTRSRFDRALFHGWRVRADGTPDPAFPLNQLPYAGGSVLAAGRNFGCGSSREHAAWALVDAGFRAVIAPSFADLFFANAVANGLLPVALPAAVVDMITDRAEGATGYVVSIDLVRRCVTDEHGLETPFTLDEGCRDRLLRGIDSISLTLAQEPAIDAFERRHEARERREPRTAD
ncbi:MAG TPA: 3-isopropylmalate dehydratase small subunit [Vicinamibacterales bacterium]|nr:3-isopropylmalate dehydratase small subunit [Vicinamibacterales bacterium]